ncbi:zinc finger protein 184-like isoform X7 [Micropterus salmoides]|uniref:zinc finger protein 184-like isoform X7 n=1 Tax=Micropterus salmoides TaxID=27706 RepID=UPI0018EAD599|nr:zinc finger protein 184-like isoform X7 [Micropterus salmoides]
MSKVQTLRAFVQQRLSAAAEEIFELFERTIAEYEEELCGQRKLLDAVFKPAADVPVLLVSEVPTEQKERCPTLDQVDPPEPPHIKEEWSPSLDQEDPPEPPHIKEEWCPRLDQEDPPEPPHIKEEWCPSLDQEDPLELPHIKEKVWTSQEGEQLRGLEEADITKFTFTLVPVKSEEDEKPQSSQLHKRLTEANGEDCEGPEPVRKSDPDRHLQQDTDKISSETDDSCDWEMSALNSLQNNEVPVSDVECNTGKTSSSSSESVTSLDQEGHLQEDNGNQPEKLSSCSVCKKTFQCRKNVARHMKIHTGEKPFSCAVCHKEFGQKEHLRQHMTIHTGEKPFSCSVCGKQFAFKTHLRRHSIVHTGEKPFSCSVCSKGFARSSALTSHLRVHTGEKPFTCSVCKDCEVQQISVQVRSKLYV